MLKDMKRPLSSDKGFLGMGQVTRIASWSGPCFAFFFVHPIATIMARYSKKSSEKVEKALHEMHEGKLKSGSGKKVTSRKQAIAIGLSEARDEGAKVPKKSGSGRRKDSTEGRRKKRIKADQNGSSCCSSTSSKDSSHFFRQRPPL